ncbi:unnamed protein product (macronuclear) [Paramecium tetraurelia]|uniref:60S ribosomal protein L37a n=2 Tax=Paramecium TaxID=5884 RepID=A0D5Y8_PARTE|nr:uncharacterized protein GSPATT00013885001 [Paramecium tetraurelia]CAD8161737.1 unnamed protein product [Paramecium octaurelia]CAK78455.1 unnamed protein product [Paramecium tetraurelia]|eukprot:XP_001445852.1 hypothetical protein (macronuclear) [Paramecium tetraurelia strain d4-2]
MTKKTKKVGITGKYGTRYGASLRKIIKKFEISQHQRYFNTFTGAHSLKRQAIGIWRCTQTGLQIAGGAWEVNTPAGLSAKQGMLRIKKLKEDAEVDIKEEKKDQKKQQPKEQKEQAQPQQKGKPQQGGDKKKAQGKKQQ